ncbi:MAG: J domain-containing protein [Treponema sp.]|nr:J domain-containing protein [Treponema sp.]
MGIFDRLGSVINSYFNDFTEQTNRRFRTPSQSSSGDPDFDAAYEELDDFLNNREPRSNYRWSDNEEPNNSRAGASGGGTSSSSRRSSSDPNQPPEELRDDFEKLGVPFGADEETCKAAYKKLMKIHHPDRHTSHPENFKKATERSARINAAWDRINKWRQEK